MTPPKAFPVFYSWQSDLPEAGNLEFIRSVLDEVAGDLNGAGGLNREVRRDEAIRDLPGSPNIAKAVFEKILRAEVFVCDLTKVAEASNHARVVRRYINPNVAMELGYAIRVLGWNRIILVVNTHYGKQAEDLPFDARGHAMVRYHYPPGAGASEVEAAKDSLRKALAEGLRAIVRTNPPRPEEAERESPEAKKRARDVEQLKRVFQFIHLKAMDTFLHWLHSHAWITKEGFFLNERLGWLLESSEFYLSDGELMRRLTEFVQAWNRCLEHYIHTDEHVNGWAMIFRANDFDDPSFLGEQIRRIRATSSHAKPLRESMDRFLAYVRENYLEIDPETTGGDAVKEYAAEEAEAKKMRELHRKLDER